jgi:hypothetical protein
LTLAPPRCQHDFQPCENTDQEIVKTLQLVEAIESHLQATPGFVALTSHAIGFADTGTRLLGVLQATPYLEVNGRGALDTEPLFVP